MSVKILSTVETSCTTQPEQIELVELAGYSWRTCSKKAQLVDCRIGVVNKLDRRRQHIFDTATNAVYNAIDSTWRNFKSGVGDKDPEGSTPNYCRDTQISLQHSMG